MKKNFLLVIIMLKLLFLTSCGKYGYLYIPKENKEQYYEQKKNNDISYIKNSYLNKILTNKRSKF